MSVFGAALWMSGFVMGSHRTSRSLSAGIRLAGGLTLPTNQFLDLRVGHVLRWYVVLIGWVNMLDEIWSLRQDQIQ